jgi:epsilon-lactone hydrolase
MTLYKVRDEGLALPGAMVAVSPWTDLALTGPSLQSNTAADPMLNAAHLPALADRYLAGADPRHHYASPLYGDASGLPPTLIHVGSDEILRDDAARMAEKLRAAGCQVEIEVWPRMPHAWHLYARILPEAAAPSRRSARSYSRGSDRSRALALDEATCSGRSAARSAAE